eukprot:6200198-Pleurochrysis_carterae.AAC.2
MPTRAKEYGGVFAHRSTLAREEQGQPRAAGVKDRCGAECGGEDGNLEVTHSALLDPLLSSSPPWRFVRGARGRPERRGSAGNQHREAISNRSSYLHESHTVVLKLKE